MLPLSRFCELTNTNLAHHWKFRFQRLGGTEDPEVPQDRLQPWEEETKERFSRRTFPGGHFYLHTDQSPMVQALIKDLTPYFETVRA